MGGASTVPFHITSGNGATEMLPASSLTKAWGDSVLHLKFSAPSNGFPLTIKLLDTFQAVAYTLLFTPSAASVSDSTGAVLKSEVLHVTAALNNEIWIQLTAGDVSPHRISIGYGSTPGSRVLLKAEDASRGCA